MRARLSLTFRRLWRYNSWGCAIVISELEPVPVVLLRPVEGSCRALHGGYPRESMCMVFLEVMHVSLLGFHHLMVSSRFSTVSLPTVKVSSISVSPPDFQGDNFRLPIAWGQCAQVVGAQLQIDACSVFFRFQYVT